MFRGFIEKNVNPIGFKKLSGFRGIKISKAFKAKYGHSISDMKKRQAEFLEKVNNNEIESLREMYNNNEISDIELNWLLAAIDYPVHYAKVRAFREDPSAILSSESSSSEASTSSDSSEADE